MPLFHMGRLFATPGALDALTEAKTAVLDLLARHRKGDWGDLDADDKRANDAALNPNAPSRIFSAYILTTGVKLYVITEWDRSVTTVLLATDY